MSKIEELKQKIALARQAVREAEDVALAERRRAAELAAADAETPRAGSARGRGF